MLSAILFDLDGTIANTDPLHYEIWREMLLDYDMEIDEQFYKSRISGGLNLEILQEILPDLSLDARSKFDEEKEAMFRRKAKNLQPLNGFAELIAWTEKHQLKRALVTNACRENAEFMLGTLGIKELFHTIVIAEECIAAKPNPAPYQTALSNLGITAEQAIALEDSPSGIRAAVGAGVRTVGVASTHEPTLLQELGAFIAIHDFTDLQLWTLLNSEMSTSAIASQI